MQNFVVQISSAYCGSISTERAAKKKPGKLINSSRVNRIVFCNLNFIGVQSMSDCLDGRWQSDPFTCVVLRSHYPSTSV